MSFSTWMNLVWWRWSTDHSRNNLSTRWVSKLRLDGSYKVTLVARRFEQTVISDTDFYAGTPKTHDFARTSRDSCNSRKYSYFWGLCHSAFHQSPTPSESEPVHVEPAPEAQLDSSKVWLCKKAFQGLKIFLQAWGIHTTESQRHELQQLISDPSTYVQKTCTTIRRFDPLSSHG